MSNTDKFIEVFSQLKTILKIYESEMKVITESQDHTYKINAKNKLPIQLPDEIALGVSYDEIDDYLEGKEIPLKSSKRIEKLYLKTEHKRNLPISVFDEWWN